MSTVLLWVEYVNAIVSSYIGIGIVPSFVLDPVSALGALADPQKLWSMLSISYVANLYWTQFYRVSLEKHGYGGGFGYYDSKATATPMDPAVQGHAFSDAKQAAILQRETELNIKLYVFLFLGIAGSYNTFAQNKYEYTASDSVATFIFFAIVFACLPFAWDYAEVGVRGLGVPSTFVFFCCSSVFSGRHRESELDEVAEDDQSYDGQPQQHMDMEHMKRSQGEFLHNLSNAFSVGEQSMPDNISGLGNIYEYEEDEYEMAEQEAAMAAYQQQMLRARQAQTQVQ